MHLTWLLTSLDMIALVEGSRGLVRALRPLPHLSQLRTRQPERVHELLLREQAHLEKPAVEALLRRHLFQSPVVLLADRDDEGRLFPLSLRDAYEYSFLLTLLLLRGVLNNVLHVALLRFARDRRRFLTRWRDRLRRGVLLLTTARAFVRALRRLFAAARRVRAKQYERARDEREQERRSDREPGRAEKSRRSQRPRLSRRTRRVLRRKFERSRLVAKLAEQPFEALDLFFALACLVPKVVAHTPRPFIPSLSRRSFIPRCRLTRTDAGCRPVRAAISGPVMPSTRRITNVSRYASGRPRIISSASRASVSRPSPCASPSCSSSVARARRWKSVARLRAIIATHGPKRAASRREPSLRKATRKTSCTRSPSSS